MYEEIQCLQGVLSHSYHNNALDLGAILQVDIVRVPMVCVCVCSCTIYCNSRWASHCKISDRTCGLKHTPTPLLHLQTLPLAPLFKVTLDVWRLTPPACPRSLVINAQSAPHLIPRLLSSRLPVMVCSRDNAPIEAESSSSPLLGPFARTHYLKSVPN